MDISRRLLGLVCMRPFFFPRVGRQGRVGRVQRGRRTDGNGGLHRGRSCWTRTLDRPESVSSCCTCVDLQVPTCGVRLPTRRALVAASAMPAATDGLQAGWLGAARYHVQRPPFRRRVQWPGGHQRLGRRIPDEPALDVPRSACQDGRLRLCVGRSCRHDLRHGLAVRHQHRTGRPHQRIRLSAAMVWSFRRRISSSLQQPVSQAGPLRRDPGLRSGAGGDEPVLFAFVLVRIHRPATRHGTAGRVQADRSTRAARRVSTAVG